MAKEEKKPTLFGLMQVLSAAQRQRFGELRRKWKAMPGIKEVIEIEGKTGIIRYRKGKKPIAEVHFGPQKLEIKEL